MSGNFDQILGIISDGVVFVGPTGAPRLVNRAARDLLGTAVASIAREARVQKQIERIRSGEATPPLDCEIEVVREQRQQRLRVQILDWKAGGGFVLVIQEKRNDEVQESGMGAVFELIRRELSAPIESFVDEATAALGAAVADAKLHEAGSDLISRLTKLTTLAQVFGTDTVLAEERIGLRELINDLWPELKHLAGARFVAVSLRANHQVMNAPLEGKEAIRKMFAGEFAKAKMVCIIENIFEDREWAILERKDPLGLRGCGFFQTKDDKNYFSKRILG